MSLQRLVVWITFLAIFAMASQTAMDSDTWWHLRAGETMLEQRTLLTADPFSHTRLGEEWHYPGWLVQIPMALIYRAAGPGGLNLWTALMVTLAFAFVWRTLVGGVFLRAFVLILAATVSGVYWAARPYLVTFLLAAIFLWLLEDFRRGQNPAAARRLVWLPILMVVWANSHGGFAAGFLLVGAYAAGMWGTRWAAALPAGGPLTRADLLGATRRAFETVAPLLWAGAALVLAVCINPFGAEMLAYPFKTVGIGALQDYIAEWQSPNFHSLQVQPFAWLLLLTLGVSGASSRRLALTDFLLVGGFGLLGLLAVRNVALFALVAPQTVTAAAAPLLESWSARLGWQVNTQRQPTRSQAALNATLLGVLALAVATRAAAIMPPEANWAVFRTMLPVDAAEALRSETQPGRLFNSYNWGAYLIWALPEYPVFVDGRTDLYDDETLGEWLAVARLEPGWQRILDERQVEIVLVETDSLLARELAHTAGWQVAYQDDLATAFSRQ